MNILGLRNDKDNFFYVSVLNVDTQQMIFNDAFACLLYEQNVNTFDVFLISFKLVALVNILIQYIEKMTSSKVEDQTFLPSFLDFL